MAFGQESRIKKNLLTEHYSEADTILDDQVFVMNWCIFQHVFAYTS